METTKATTTEETTTSKPMRNTVIPFWIPLPQPAAVPDDTSTEDGATTDDTRIDHETASTATTEWTRKTTMEYKPVESVSLPEISTETPPPVTTIESLLNGSLNESRTTQSETTRSKHNLVTEFKIRKHFGDHHGKDVFSNTHVSPMTALSETTTATPLRKPLINQSVDITNSVMAKKASLSTVAPSLGADTTTVSTTAAPSSSTRKPIDVNSKATTASRKHRRRHRHRGKGHNRKTDTSDIEQELLRILENLDEEYSSTYGG